MDTLNAKFGDKVFMILINIEKQNVAEPNSMKFKEKCGGFPSGIAHAHAQPPADFGLAYIPHKVVVGADGVVIKNYDNVTLDTDVPQLAA